MTKISKALESAMNRNTYLENRINEKNEQIETLNREIASLKMALATDLQDIEPKKLPSQQYSEWDTKNSAADAKLRSVMEWAGRNKINKSYSDDPLELQAAGLGVMLGRLFSYYGTPILLMAAHGLEDCNWHNEAAVLFQMYEDQTKDNESEPVAVNGASPIVKYLRSVEWNRK